MRKVMITAAVYASATLTKDSSVEHDHKFLGAKFKPFKLDEKMTVHLVHHSHDDVGWLKTIDDYFSGAKRMI